jgi:hypothetical protein
VSLQVEFGDFFTGDAFQRVVGVRFFGVAEKDLSELTFAEFLYVNQILKLHAFGGFPENRVESTHFLLMRVFILLQHGI